MARHIKSPETRKFLSVLVAGFGCIGLAVGIVSGLGTVMFLRNAVSVPGKVTGSKAVTSRGSRGPSTTFYSPVVTFNDAQGLSRNITSSEFNEFFYSAGDTVNVLYVPNNLKNYRLGTWLDLWSKAAGWSVVGAIMLLIGVAAFKTAQREILHQSIPSNKSPISKPKLPAARR